MGFRVVKTAIAAFAAIMIAHWVGIPSATSAGLLAILGLDTTIKRSVKTVVDRFFASIVGLAVACTLFGLLGFHYWVVPIYILLAFPLIVRASFKGGIVTNAVVVFHVFNAGVISWPVLLTEVELLVIGLGSAMLVNLVYMPNPEEALSKVRSEADQCFSKIFAQFARTLRNPNYLWDGKELIEADKKVAQGLVLAHRSLENQLMKADEFWSVYFYMRKQQLESIQTMAQLVSQVYEQISQAELTAELFDQLERDVRQEHYTGKAAAMLHELEEKFKEMKLPETREEFEVRAAILQLCRELKGYLEMSRRSKAPHHV
ncbi:aromatic acid exporter family protein [Saccharibacillus sp. CPCC 101409]|uniref:aromatic acid exporter family protein n=1 Tax=Saccharibacillus sp. CPCC 101409 TaxID=3058041 RepID=UPI0026724B7E|nr:aromatic acid exporter family protein [Saccharibacillus sp. CPCC 101409]MDO3411845.1 aromatic acid exporter family protein [Saccharibacillus sp. CPCC 101409]